MWEREHEKGLEDDGKELKEGKWTEPRQRAGETGEANETSDQRTAYLIWALMGRSRGSLGLGTHS